MSKFNQNKSNKTKNLAGGDAFSMQPKQELLHAVLSTFLEDKYYESGDERVARIISLIPLVPAEYVAKLAFIARNEFMLRSVPIVLLAELSKTYRGDSLVSRAIQKTVARVDDLTELVSYLDCKLPKQVKKGIRRALLKFSPYQLAKYRGAKKNVKLVDLFNLVHPNPKFASPIQQEAWQNLMRGELKTTGQTWESVISASKDKKRDWENLIKENKLGYMALLRNLNNLIENGVDEEIIDIAISKLTNPEQVRKSKQLPFRFYTAYENVSGNRKLTDAISLAMDIAVENTPRLEGKTLIAIDGSGSMSGDPIQKASIFAATLAKANINADVILFDEEVQELNLSSRTPVIDLARDIITMANGGGTDTALVFRYAGSMYSDKKVKYDRIIILSDNQAWVGGVQEWYNHYRVFTQDDPYVYAIDIEGYGTKDIVGNKVINLCGWSSKLLDFIGVNEKGSSMVDYIDSIEL